MPEDGVRASAWRLHAAAYTFSVFWRGGKQLTYPPYTGVGTLRRAAPAKT